MVTSLDESYPGENAIDPDERLFWISTGLYPQEILLALGRPAQTLVSVRIVCTHVRSFLIEGCDEETPVNFKTLFKAELEDRQGRMQAKELRADPVEPGLAPPRPMGFIKMVILSGWSDFVSLHLIHVEGDAAENIGRLPKNPLSLGPTAELSPGQPKSPPRQASGTRGLAMARKITMEVLIPEPNQRKPAAGEPDAPRERADTSPWEHSARGLPSHSEDPEDLGTASAAP